MRNHFYKERTAAQLEAKVGVGGEWKETKTSYH